MRENYGLINNMRVTCNFENEFTKMLAELYDQVIQGVNLVRAQIFRSDSLSNSKIRS